ncbi:HAD family hydrolase [Thermopirellula anaerolimosa]
MIRAVLFDLDDTLYPEIDYYRQGFSAVAEELACRGIGSAENLLAVLERLHFADREAVFDRASEKLGFPHAWVPDLLDRFRNREIRLRLPPETDAILHALCPFYRLGIVTDGHAAVQERKLAALGLIGRVDTIVVCDRLGRRHWKPDSLPFHTACRNLKVRPHEAIFVGDHPHRDIFGAIQAGLGAIRIRTSVGWFRDRPNLPEVQPWAEIERLDQLPEILRSEIIPVALEAVR